MSNIEIVEEFVQWFYTLNILTYGEIDNEETLDDIQTILQWKHDGVFISDNIPNNKFTVKEHWLLLSILEECIEYGTSPRGAWLTDLGKSVLNTIKNNKQEILKEI